MVKSGSKKGVKCVFLGWKNNSFTVLTISDLVDIPKPQQTIFKRWRVWRIIESELIKPAILIRIKKINLLYF